MKINIKTTKGILIAGAAAIGLAFAAPAATAHDGMNISLDSLELKFGDEDFLESLIAMDADDIAEIRSEMAEARAEIRDAIKEVADARREAAESPETKDVILVALSTGAAAVEETTKGVFEKVRSELNRAEGELADKRDEVGPAEFAETNEAISTIRSELAEVEVALGELLAAMRSA